MIARHYRPLLAALVLTTGLTACGGDTAEQQAPAAQPQPSQSDSSEHSGAAAASGSVGADDQTTDGTTLTVREVVLDGVEQGFIGVHQDLDGKPGPVVGVAEIKQGTTTDLVVTFDEPVATGAFWPMLHVDDGELGLYEFPETPGTDLPVTDGEDIVMQKIEVTVD